MGSLRLKTDGGGGRPFRWYGTARGGKAWHVRARCGARRWLAAAVLVAGCGSDPYPRLEGGTRAILFDPHARSLRVETDPGRGMAGSDMQLLDVGTAVLVTADGSARTDEARPVHAKVLDGDHRGLHARVERHHLKPEAY